MLNYPKPREGTETHGFRALVDGHLPQLNYPKPREGTETYSAALEDAEPLLG